MPKEFTNNRKVEVKIQRILSELISLKISDPRLKNIIISEVRLNNDISTAKVYFLVLNNKTKTNEINSILKKATGFFKKEMSAQLDLKKLPNLIFIYDTKEQDALFINNLIDKAIMNDQKSK
jgi:ribosome-binding factor A